VTSGLTAKLEYHRKHSLDMAREVIPLSKRPFDVMYFVFYLINLFLITYCVDVEQSKADSSGTSSKIR